MYRVNFKWAKPQLIDCLHEFAQWTIVWLKQFRVAHCVACCHWKVCKSCLIKTVQRCSPCGVLLLKKVYNYPGSPRVVYYNTSLPLSMSCLEFALVYLRAPGGFPAHFTTYFDFNNDVIIYIKLPRLKKGGIIRYTFFRFRLDIFCLSEPFQRGDHLYTSGSDVCRRQILTYKDDSRTERI